jgi:hypothetical protein
MSSMLEQAIVDARALKEAAIKNAENLVIEKYSEEVKRAVNQLLEDEDPLGDEEEEVHGSVDDLPDSFKDASEGDDVVEIDLDQLSAAVEKALDGEIESHEDAAEDIADMALEEPPEGMPGSPEPGPDTLAESGTESAIEVDIDEDLLESVASDLIAELDLENIDEESIEEIIEKVVVDIEPVKSGWAGTPEAHMKEKEDMALAKEIDTEYAEEMKSLRTRVAELQEQNETLVSAGQKLQTKSETLEGAIETLKNKISETNVMNAKLLYINQTLGNASLNERQKKKIVEAISKAKSVENAKVLFETLQSTVGSTDKSPLPESLSEAVSRKPSLMVASRNQTAKQDNSPFFDRMKTLAGLKNN